MCAYVSQVTQFYTAPTAIRALMREGNAPVEATSRKSLRLLGSVGEPINPEAWLWYHNVVGNGDWEEGGGSRDVGGITDIV